MARLGYAPNMGRSRLSIAVVAIAMMIACRPPAPPGTLSLAAEIDGRITVAGAVAWSADRPLRWSDFASPSPKSGDEGALTAYSVFYGARCTGNTFDFLAIAGFLPRDSWVRPDVMVDRDRSERTLRHEQTHFDLTEVFTRRLRKSFSDLYQPCLRVDRDLDTLAAQYLQAEKVEQQRYDDETRHGLATAAQDAWDRRVKDDLQTLKAFSR
jgi:hypothetical protein